MVTSTIEATCYHVNKGISNKRDFVFEDFQLSIDTPNKKKKKNKNQSITSLPWLQVCQVKMLKGNFI